MKHFGKDEISQTLARQRALPLFNCGDAANGMQVLEALHAGGIRFFNSPTGRPERSTSSARS